MKQAILRGSACVLMLVSSTAFAQDGENVDEIKATPVTDEPAPVAEPPPGDNRSPIDAVKGNFGFGYFTGVAPLGMRYWTSRDLAFDAGLDFAFASGDLSVARLGGELGLVYALGHFHYAVPFLRGGLGFTWTDNVGGTETVGSYAITGSAFLGVELFLGALGFPNVSLQGGYGVEATYRALEGGGGGTFLIGTSAGALNIVGTGTFGFHIYI